MSRINPELDIIKDILEAVLKAQPLSSFTQSLLYQYVERGGLSKKQLQGLYSKAEKINTIPVAKLAKVPAKGIFPPIVNPAATLIILASEIPHW